MSRRDKISLYVRNISDWTRQDDLRYVFEKYGVVRDIYIPLDYYTRRPRGFAYVEFEDARDADDAMRDLDGYRLNGREIEIEFAQGDRKSSTQMRSKYDAVSSRDYDDRDRSSRRRRSRSRSVDRDRRRRRRSRSRTRSRTRSRSRSRDRDRRSRHRRSSNDRRKSRSRSQSKSKERERNGEKTESNSRSASSANGAAENGSEGGQEYEEETAD
uniref:RRM domain-containing protein n=1 Tax=Plectus sambesii TaxID=2011161 RepID=A0A914VG99_9BILA